MPPFYRFCEKNGTIQCFPPDRTRPIGRRLTDEWNTDGRDKLTTGIENWRRDCPHTEIGFLVILRISVAPDIGERLLQRVRIGDGVWGAPLKSGSTISLDLAIVGKGERKLSTRSDMLAGTATNLDEKRIVARAWRSKNGHHFMAFGRCELEGFEDPVGRRRQNRLRRLDQKCLVGTRRNPARQLDEFRSELVNRAPVDTRDKPMRTQ